MEQNNPGSMFELQVDHESRNHFRETTKWTNFIAIIFFVCFGLMLLILLLAGSLLTNLSTTDMSGMEGYRDVSPGLIAFQMILFAAFLVVMIYGGIMLLRFSSNCRRGVEVQDQLSFNRGLKALRNYFILMGCLAILSIVSDVLGIINSLT